MLSFGVSSLVSSGIELSSAGGSELSSSGKDGSSMTGEDMAGAGDVIVLAGKGHETYQEIKGVKHPFDEKIVVAELLAER